ncbi:MAG: DNA primase [Spirochaetota bacterium]
MRYSQDTIDQLLDRVDILALVRNYVPELENRAGRWWGCCPFHDEKTPSFTLNPERKSYYCFGCQEKGNAISLLMKLDRLSFSETLQKLSQISGFALPQGAESKLQIQNRKQREALYSLYAQVHKSFRQNLRSERGQIARTYLVERKVRPDLVDLFELGYAIKEPNALYAWLRRQNYSVELLRESGLFSQRKEEVSLFRQRLIFPVFDPQGRVIAFSGRQLVPDSSSPKYINSRESPIYRKSESLFGLYQSLKSLRRERSLVLCEGNLDVLAWFQAGITNAAAPLGTAFTPEQARLLKRYCDKVVLAFDGDEAGQTAIYKGAFLLEQEELSSQIIAMAPGRDPSDILEHEGAEDLKALAHSPQDFFNFLAVDLGRRFALDELTGISAALRFLSPFMSQLKPGLRRELYIAQFARLFRLKQDVLAAETSWRYAPAKQASAKPPAERPVSHAAGPLRPPGPPLKMPVPAAGNSPAELVEREFWASLLLQADLYPQWQELLAQVPWESEDARFLKKLLDQALKEQNLNFETLCDRVSRQVPDLGKYLLEKKLEPLQGGGINDPEGYDITSYREAILQQKYCGVQEFRLRERKEKTRRQIEILESEESGVQLQLELLEEIQGFDRKLLDLRERIQQLQKEIRHSSKPDNFPMLEKSPLN